MIHSFIHSLYLYTVTCSKLKVCSSTRPWYKTINIKARLKDKYIREYKYKQDITKYDKRTR